jgi:hypothetical protein
MKKLQLSIEELAVESFETQKIEGERGTVHGHTQYDWMCTAEVSCDYGCNTRQDGTCPTANTCEWMCGQPTQPYKATCPPACYN